MNIFTIPLNYPVDTPSMTPTNEHYMNIAIWSVAAGLIAHFAFHKHFLITAGITAAVLAVDAYAVNNLTAQ
jgi:hypothetical protein